MIERILDERDKVVLNTSMPTRLFLGGDSY